MKHRTLAVALPASPARHYPIHIGHGLLADAALIAACAIRHNLTLVTRNTRDFLALQVPLFNPFSESV